MWKALPSCLCLLVALVFVNADIYMHNPRGCNNRLNENSKGRRNANRLFDSQNNNNGGYNVGDATSGTAGNDAKKQYQMKYFQSGADLKEDQTILSVEWTNQHGCGGTAASLRKTNCNLVLQFMCQPNDNTVPAADKIRPGVITNTQPFSYMSRQYRSLKLRQDMKNRNVKQNMGLHETWEDYDKCIHRENNEGLFLADQKLKKIGSFRGRRKQKKTGVFCGRRKQNETGLFLADQKLKKIGKYSRAIHTRQNNNGQRRGYECPEERDYYPYWHPTPWVDIGVLTDNTADCKQYREGSFNKKPYEECAEEITDGKKCEWIRRSRWNNKEDCETHGGKWLSYHNFLEKLPQFTNKTACLKASKAADREYIWGLPSDAVNITKYECLVVPPEVVCLKSPYSRVNHLGNGLSGQANTFNWVLPNFPSNKEQRCVLRMRYNITTGDYDPKTVDASHNGKHVTNDPTVKFGNVPLKLAINTAQFGRTFQDRTHPFILRSRPESLQKGKIYNLNVRGKRGNIVEVYPAVEYDFTPNTMWLKSSDMLHIQWTGSNSNPNNNAGEGKRGSDRSNFLQMEELDLSYPLPFEKANMLNSSEIVWIHHGQTGVSVADLAIDMASAGYYNCIKATGCPASLAKNVVGKKAAMSTVLDNAPASYEGAVLKFKKGIYYYMCTRNNNFTNRSQKGTLRVE